MRSPDLTSSRWTKRPLREVRLIASTFHDDLPLVFWKIVTFTRPRTPWTRPDSVTMPPFLTYSEEAVSEIRARWARSAAPSTSVEATEAVLEQTLVTRMQVSRAEMMRKESPGDVCGPAILHPPEAGWPRDSQSARD